MRSGEDSASGKWSRVAEATPLLLWQAAHPALTRIGYSLAENDWPNAAPARSTHQTKARTSISLPQACVTYHKKEKERDNIVGQRTSHRRTRHARRDFPATGPLAGHSSSRDSDEPPPAPIR